MKSCVVLVMIFSLLTVCGFSQIVLLGDNSPHGNVNDGDFNSVRATWRQAKQSPFWTTRNVPGKGDRPMGLDMGRLFCSNEMGIAESKPLKTYPEYSKPQVGDVWNWSFGADLEYVCHGTLSLSLVFGEHERLLAEKVKLIGSDKTVEHFEGTYSITREDAEAGMPFVRVVFYSEQEVKVYLDYVNICVISDSLTGPILTGRVTNEGMALRWDDVRANDKCAFYVYRKQNEKEEYKKLGETTAAEFRDHSVINGVPYTYLVTRLNQAESGPSNKITLTKYDEVAPEPPSLVRALVDDTEITITWNQSIDNDVAYYSVFRGDANGNYKQEVASRIKGTAYLDFTPVKDIENTYEVYSCDYSGNFSVASTPVKARLKMVSGASFSDLICPMPMVKGVRSDLWGAPGVLPRDPDNGIEDPEWSYWGGRPVKDVDGLYHMLITRWPANGLKGHWEWPNSTVAYTVADLPAGPYRVKRDLAYDFYGGLGHNPDIILLNDGTYLLYALIDWKATLFHAKTMRGPWKRLGEMIVDWQSSGKNEALSYRYYRNLSGVQLEDGRFLFVTKGGEMMMSDDDNPLGPYQVITEPIRGNAIIPKAYRNSNYEDPVLWKDEVQYHMIINAFLDYRAIYLRSPDGIHWKFNPGTAYTPNNTFYEDGTPNLWNKLERPHVLQDQYGRATHLSLAAVDVPKEDDLAGDSHNSKNLILPLVVPRRLKMLNTKPVDQTTGKIKILILSEPGFNALKDVDRASLRFGASEVVDVGGGCRAIKYGKRGKDLMVVFNGAGNGMTDDDFVCKLLGKTIQGKLLFGYTKPVAEPK